MAGLWLPSSSWKACGFQCLQLDHAPPRCSLPRNSISRVARKSREQGSKWHSSRLNAVLFKWKLSQCSKSQNENYSQQTGCSSSQFQSCQKKADPHVGSRLAPTFSSSCAPGSHRGPRRDANRDLWEQSAVNLGARKGLALGPQPAVGTGVSKAMAGSTPVPFRLNVPLGKAGLSFLFCEMGTSPTSLEY